MTDRELMQQALDALDLLSRYENPATKLQVRKPRDGGPIVTIYPHKVAKESAEPLRARLAQPDATNPKSLQVQEPVAWMHPEWRTYTRAPSMSITPKEDWIPLYTAPPQREWHGLEDELWGLLDAVENELNRRAIPEAWLLMAHKAGRAYIEAKRKEKNT